MNRKPDGPRKSTSPPGSSGSGKHLWVVCSEGSRNRFLRGIITHDLMLRGLGFDDAYAAARAIRDRLGDRESVTTAEIRDLVQEQLVTMFGKELPVQVQGPLQAVPDLRVIYQGQEQPFSRGLLARSIHAAGPDLDRAYWLVTQLQADLLNESPVPSREIARRVTELLEEHETKETAWRYQLVRRVHRLPRPLVIYIGGASGTGKSTLALALAPLLRIYRITATDTVRQVMRMVFSQPILPALHSSSFEVTEPLDGSEEEELLLEADGSEGDEARLRLIRSFQEQATRVNVGVRAVVERAIAENMSIVIEGVHLYPPAVPFADLEGAAYQVPLMLGTMNEEMHRTRFLLRARRGGRKAERFLDHFPAIRMLHDFLLDSAEAHDVGLLDTSAVDDGPIRAMRLLTGVLEKRIPRLGPAGREASGKLIPTLLVIIDGLPDRPTRALGGRTPLQAAETPTLDRLAREGQCGLGDAIGPGVVPDTAAGTLALLGQSPLAISRGPVEALGSGIQMKAGDIALRGNFATLSADGVIVDRRAGRIRQGAPALAQALNGIRVAAFPEVKIKVGAGTEHRLAIVLRGPGLSSSISGSDPGDGAPPGPPLTPAAIDPNDLRAVTTAAVLDAFEREAHRVLAAHPLNEARRKAGLPPANAILTRGAGRMHYLVPLEDGGVPLKLACVAGDKTILGLMSWLGAETITDDKLTANLDTDVALKFDLALNALREKDLVVLHLKGADIAAHDQRPEQKAAFLEDVDRHLGVLMEKHPEPLRIVVGADHATLSESGQHSADPSPVVIWGKGIDADETQVFDEHAAAGGGLRRFSLQMLLRQLFDLA